LPTTHISTEQGRTPLDQQTGE